MSRFLPETAWLAAFLALCAPSALGAQGLTGGIQAGVALASFVNEDAPSDRRMGVRLGGFLDLALTDMLGARLEGAYVTKGVESADSDVTVALDYIEVPLLARVSFPGAVAPTVFTGPALGIKVKGELRTPEGDSDYGDLVKPVDFGWAVGAGVAPSVAGRDLLVEVRYTRGLRSVYDFGDPDDSDSDDKNQVISVGLGLTLF